jgi:hypothetical protein
MMEDHVEAFEIPKHRDKLTVSLQVSPQIHRTGIECPTDEQMMKKWQDDEQMKKNGGTQVITDEGDDDLDTPDLSGVYDAEEARLFYVLDVNSFQDINASFLRNAEQNGAREGIPPEEFKGACDKCWEIIHWIVEHQGFDLEDPHILADADIYNDIYIDMPPRTQREQHAPEPQIFYIDDNRSMSNKKDKSTSR